MVSSTLRLTESTDAGPLRLERRRSERHALGGQVTAIHLSSRGELSRKICSLRVVNLSDCGMGAIGSQAMEIGSEITAYFPSHGPEHGFELTGIVARCHKRGEGVYELGIDFTPRTAA